MSALVRLRATTIATGGSIGAGNVCFREGLLNDWPDGRRSIFRDECEWDPSDGIILYPSDGLLSENATIIWPGGEGRLLFRTTFEWDPSDDRLLSVNATIMIYCIAVLIGL